VQIRRGALDGYARRDSFEGFELLDARRLAGFVVGSFRVPIDQHGRTG
jgi:hypothetical protein